MSEEIMTDMSTNDGIETGVELWGLMNMEENTLEIPKTHSEFKEISDFFGQYEDGGQVARRIMAKKTSPDMTPMEYMLGYVRLRKEHQEVLTKKDRLEQDLRYYE